MGMEVHDKHPAKLSSSKSKTTLLAVSREEYTMSKKTIEKIKKYIKRVCNHLPSGSWKPIYGNH
jgi:hypothetical protein